MRIPPQTIHVYEVGTLSSLVIQKEENKYTNDFYGFSCLLFPFLLVCSVAVFPQ